MVLGHPLVVQRGIWFPLGEDSLSFKVHLVFNFTPLCGCMCARMYTCVWVCGFRVLFKCQMLWLIYTVWLRVINTLLILLSIIIPVLAEHCRSCVLQFRSQHIESPDLAIKWFFAPWRQEEILRSWVAFETHWFYHIVPFFNPTRSL